MGLFKRKTNNNADDAPKTIVQEENRERDSQRKMTTTQFLEHALKKLGCKLKKGEGEDEYYTLFQGEHFRIFASDDYKYIEIQDLAWYDAPLHDINNMSLMRKAINDCNVSGQATLVYSIYEEDDQFVVHSLKEAYWSAEIEHAEEYLNSIFNRLLQSHQRFFSRMEALRQAEFSKNQ